MKLLQLLICDCVASIFPPISELIRTNIRENPYNIRAQQETADWDTRGGQDNDYSPVLICAGCDQ